MSDTQTTGMTPDQRTAILNGEIAKWASKGWIVQHADGGQAVLSQNKRIGWFWNLILTLLTGGLWLIVVIVRVVNRKKLTMIITVDQYGKVHRA